MSSSVNEDQQVEQDALPQLALVTLTPENKRLLFKYATKVSERAMERTQALMARLEQLDPSVARLFGLKNIATSKAPFDFCATYPSERRPSSG